VERGADCVSVWLIGARCRSGRSDGFVDSGWVEDEDGARVDADAEASNQ
jgi:hypothetical protein